MMTEEELYEKILDTWGVESQLQMLQEECAEVIVAVSKVMRGNLDSWRHLSEELANCSIMIAQIKLLCPDFEKIRLEKLERVKGLLEAKG